MRRFLIVTILLLLAAATTTAFAGGADGRSTALSPSWSDQLEGFFERLVERFTIGSTEGTPPSPESGEPGTNDGESADMIDPIG